MTRVMKGRIFFLAIISTSNALCLNDILDISDKMGALLYIHDSGNEDIIF